jgi:hypothetical protein
MQLIIFYFLNQFGRSGVLRIVDARLIYSREQADTALTISNYNPPGANPLRIRSGTRVSIDGFGRAVQAFHE